MARTVNREAYNPNRAKLEPSDLEGTAALLTIINADEIAITDHGRPDGFRMALVLQFAEPEGKAMWPNATQSQTLIQMLGEDLDEWTDKVIPVEARDVRFGREIYHKVCVIEAREWQEAFESAGADYTYQVFTPTAKKAAPKKSTKKAKKR